MKSLHTLATTALALALLAGSPALAAEGALAPEEQRYLDTGKATQRIAEAYFAAYIARDWEALEPLLHESGSMADPTAEQLFGSVQFNGKAQMLSEMRKAYAGIESMRFTPMRRFFSADHALFEGTLDWTVAIGKGKKVATEAMPFVVVLKVSEGKVIEHRDYADYAPFIAAFRQVRGNRQ